MATDWHARARGVTRGRSDGWVRCFSQTRQGSYVSVCVCPGTSIRSGELLLNCEDIRNLTVRRSDRRGGVLSDLDECCGLTA